MTRTIPHLTSTLTFLALVGTGQSSIAGDYTCSASPGTCQVTAVARTGIGFTLEIAKALPSRNIITVTTPDQQHEFEIRPPDDNLAYCTASTTCANGQELSCSTPLNVSASACSSGGGTVSCMYIAPAYDDKWVVEVFSCT